MFFKSLEPPFVSWEVNNLTINAAGRVGTSKGIGL